MDQKLSISLLFLAWFCLTPNNYQNYQQIFNTVLEEYSKFHHLSDYEINTIPSLIKASYAAYFLKTSILTNQGDNSSETKEWLKLPLRCYPKLKT